jgi:hypothetical protein
MAQKCACCYQEARVTREKKERQSGGSPSSRQFLLVVAKILYILFFSCHGKQRLAELLWFHQMWAMVKINIHPTVFEVIRDHPRATSRRACQDIDFLCWTIYRWFNVGPMTLLLDPCSNTFTWNQLEGARLCCQRPRIAQEFHGDRDVPSRRNKPVPVPVNAAAGLRIRR